LFRSLYDAVYRRLAVEHQIAFLLPAPRASVIGVALSRNRPDFTERDRSILETTKPMIVQAYERAVTLALMHNAVRARARRGRRRAGDHRASSEWPHPVRDSRSQGKPERTAEPRPARQSARAARLLERSTTPARWGSAAIRRALGLAVSKMLRSRSVKSGRLRLSATPITLARGAGRRNAI